jgi:hypothetical protein
MELTPYLETLHRDLTAAAAAGGDLLGSAIESSGRLCLLEALSDAAAEITTKLSTGTVEVRLRGREAQFVVEERDVTPSRAEPVLTIEAEGDVARITLRLPESLKEAVEAAATRGVDLRECLARPGDHQRCRRTTPGSSNRATRTPGTTLHRIRPSLKPTRP